ncbi:MULTISPECIES: hypothetical protein [unclassified Nostoc]|uniref:hypothetical protein n=1 Tax=unclassified Nostoc TaxID=2593658 RepID=UPI001D3354F2|nr:hypothetical protein [Nostoc sp. JL23]MBN3879594.1 hypothetical protein [Nostoc sp. JL23]
MIEPISDRLCVKQSCSKGRRNDTYQQALDDFGITQLLSRLSNYCDAEFNATWIHLTEQEIDCIAALLIQQLTVNLKGSVIGNYLHILRTCQSEIISDLPATEFKAISTPQALPEDFPQNTIPPLFWCGDRIRWIPVADEPETNSGIIIGRFFAYAQHQAQWTWKYLIWLHNSSNVVVVDTAWEQDIEPISEEPVS